MPRLGLDVLSNNLTAGFSSTMFSRIALLSVLVLIGMLYLVLHHLWLEPFGGCSPCTSNVGKNLIGPYPENTKSVLYSKADSSHADITNLCKTLTGDNQDTANVFDVGGIPNFSVSMDDGKTFVNPSEASVEKMTHFACKNPFVFFDPSQYLTFDRNTKKPLRKEYKSIYDPSHVFKNPLDLMAYCNDIQHGNTRNPKKSNGNKIYLLEERGKKKYNYNLNNNQALCFSLLDTNQQITDLKHQTRAHSVYNGLFPDEKNVSVVKPQEAIDYCHSHFETKGNKNGIYKTNFSNPQKNATFECLDATGKPIEVAEVKRRLQHNGSVNFSAKALAENQSQKGESPQIPGLASILKNYIK